MTLYIPPHLVFSDAEIAEAQAEQPSDNTASIPVFTEHMVRDMLSPLSSDLGVALLLQRLDASLYDFTSDQFSKVAFVVGRALDLVSIQHDELAPLIRNGTMVSLLIQRMESLIRRGILETVGSPWRPRFSEVKRSLLPFTDSNAQ